MGRIHKELGDFSERINRKQTNCSISTKSISRWDSTEISSFSYSTNGA